MPQGPPPPNLPLTPFGRTPGGGTDAPDPFIPQPRLDAVPAVPPAPAAASAAPRTLPASPLPVSGAEVPRVTEASPLAPSVFRQPTVHRGRRWLIIFAGSIIVLLLIGALVLVGLRYFFNGQSFSFPAASTTTPEESPLLPAASSPPSSTTSPASSDVEDPDKDGLTNAEERFYGSDAAKSDTDGDGYSDGDEVRGGYDPLSPGKLDSDNDGFPDPDERSFGSDPFNPDTDGDGYSDGAEIKNGYNPLIASPGDKL